MLTPAALRRRVLDLVARTVDHPAYLLLIVFLAFATTATASMPFVVILIAAVLLSPKRWLTLALAAALGSGAGGATLFELFHVWGWAEIITRFPDLAASSAFSRASLWLEHWGLPALAFIAGSPLPQTPALFLCAIGNYSFASVFLAVFVGKLLKYSFVAWLAATFPQRVMRRLRSVS